MALDGMIFDLDGTLIDCNPAHVEAWRRAFESCGFKVPPDRIALEVGKGGDFLVSAVLGPGAEQEYGERLRQKSMEEFLDVARRQHFRLFPGVPDLIRRLRQRGIKTALATSSKPQHLEATWASAGRDLTGEFDVVVTAGDTRRSKPAPDLVHAALDKMGFFPAQCAMVGDTPYDAQAALQAGVVCLGVLCSGNPLSALRRAGARVAWQDPADLLGHLDEALAVASPGPHHWTRLAAEGLMREALAAAREGMADGEAPAGCVLAAADGSVLARGHSEVRRTGNRAAHAALSALAAAARQGAGDARDTVLVCTLEPCPLCTGAAALAGADSIFFGLPALPDDGTRRLRPSESGRRPLPRVAGGVLEPEIRAMFEEYSQTVAEPEQQTWARHLLDAAGSASGK